MNVVVALLFIRCVYVANRWPCLSFKLISTDPYPEVFERQSEAAVSSGGAFFLLQSLVWKFSYRCRQSSKVWGLL